MTTERPDTLAARSTEEHSHSAARDAEPGLGARTNAPAPASPFGKADRSSDRSWGWARTLRFAIMISALFWLIVGVSVWAFFNAG